MVTLDKLRGQDRVVSLLRRALAADRVAHAYLFCGPQGSGKHTTGLALAAALNCTQVPNEGCGECAQCQKIAGSNHPDVRTLERQGAAQIIPIEVIRNQVVPAMAMAPHEGRARVFLIEEANALQGPSANALLKTLEEPPARTHFVLCTSSPGELLPTIRSRCQRVAFAALPASVRTALDRDDEGAAERQAELVGALMNAIELPGPSAVHAVAAEAGQEKSAVAPTLIALAERLHADARRFAGQADLVRAGQRGRQAQLVLDTHFAVTMHNAHGQLAFESLLYQLRGVHA